MIYVGIDKQNCYNKLLYFSFYDKKIFENSCHFVLQKGEGDYSWT